MHLDASEDRAALQKALKEFQRYSLASISSILL